MINGFRGIRSTQDLKNYFNIEVFLDKKGEAEGFLYIDDYQTFNYTKVLYLITYYRKCTPY